MRREPITIGQECAFWTVESGPVTVKSTAESPRPLPHWICLCRCGRRKTILDANLKNIRDGRTNERFWSCGCVAKELRKLQPKQQQSECYNLKRDFPTSIAV